MYHISFKDTEQKSTIILRIYRSQLLDDIRLYAFMIAQNYPFKEERLRKNLIDICEKGYIHIVTRLMNLAFQECVNILHPFSKTPVDDNTLSTDEFVQPSVYPMTLTVPTTFTKGAISLLEKQVHKFIVYRVLTEFLTISGLEVLPLWQQKLKDVQDELYKTRNLRLGKPRLRLRPWNDYTYIYKEPEEDKINQQRQLDPMALYWDGVEADFTTDQDSNIDWL